MCNKQTNICFSGGAIGADTAWCDAAIIAGHQVINYSFQKHKTDAPSHTLYRLSEAELAEADEHLKVANKTLKRYLPFHKPWIINLLRRNYYQIRDTHSVYAVSKIDKKGLVEGGSAWAVYMFVDKLKYEGKQLDDCPIYVYSQVTRTWMQLEEDGWFALDKQPPTPHGLWTGIGTRDLTDDGALAIKSIFGGSNVG